MTHRMQSNHFSEAVQLLADNGFEGMANAMHHTPKVEMRKQVADDIRNIFNAADAHHTQEELARFVDRYQETAPKLAAWAEANIAESLVIFGLPSEHRKRMRTTNMLERQNRELKLRTRVASLFPTKPPFYDSSQLFSSNSVTNGKPECDTSHSKTKPKLIGRIYRKTVALSLRLFMAAFYWECFCPMWSLSV